MRNHVLITLKELTYVGKLATLFGKMSCICLLTLIADQPITWQRFSALRHVGDFAEIRIKIRILKVEMVVAGARRHTATVRVRCTELICLEEVHL